ncbi:unnamed protein product [Rotaria magnacalcarata]|uniref:Uncharacterized protein n=1 Tax=Rotaria magnacalcarata TaxID=392030 RepID=A0A819GBQ0_9BILA|nr:unnamed protein product [Rotaria magnacalcarata]
MIRAVQKSKLVYNQEQLSLKSLADRKKEQSEKHEHTNEEMKKLIDRENQLLSKQKGLHDKKRKHNCCGYYIDAQNANVLIGAGDEQVKLISDELFKITDELLKIQNCKIDLRADPQISAALKAKAQKQQSAEDENKIAVEIKVNAYMECSAKIRQGVQESLTRMLLVYL